jgi:hypothetical protein
MKNRKLPGMGIFTRSIVGLPFGGLRLLWWFSWCVYRSPRRRFIRKPDRIIGVWPQDVVDLLPVLVGETVERVFDSTFSHGHPPYGFWFLTIILLDMKPTKILFANMSS